MSRVFNTAGPCHAVDHYMIPPLRRLAQVRDLIDGKYYFVVHAPRQTGKTTLIKGLGSELNQEGKHAAIVVSVESLTDPRVEVSIPQMLDRIAEAAGHQLPEARTAPEIDEWARKPLVGLRGFLSAWSDRIDVPLVVLLDEVDSLPGPVLVSVLRQLRDGYTSRPAPGPASVALVGMRDVREYRADVRPGGESLGSSSPFNIKVRSLTLRNFDQDEVAELLQQHTSETGQAFTSEAVAGIYEQTRGQPWLVNALAAQLVTDFDALVPDRGRDVTREHVLSAREILIQRRDTHLDSLVGRLREERVRRVIEPILTGSAEFDASFDDDFVYVSNLGLVTQEEGRAAIANPIYREIIPRILSFHVQMAIAAEPAWYVDDDGHLDVPGLIDGFVEFWRENGEALLRGMPYQEAAPHLVFMAFLQRIVNQGGRITREFAVGTRRADLVVEFGGRRDVIELKLKTAPKARERGIEQVSSYARSLGRDAGYLIIFDPGADTPWEERGSIENEEHEGVRVTVVQA